MTLESFWQIFWIQTSMSLIVCLLGAYQFSKRSFPIQLITVLFGLGFICNVLSYVATKSGLTNLPGSIYDMLSFIIISVLYNDAFKKKFSAYIWLLITAFTLVSLVNLMFFQKTEIASFNKLLSSFIFIVYTIVYFYTLLLELPTTHIQRLPMFWINSSLLIYSAGSLFLFAFTTYIIKVLDNNLLTYWTYHNSLSIIEHLIVIVGITYDIRYPKVQQSV
jgi:hypothetical protein